MSAIQDISYRRTVRLPASVQRSRHPGMGANAYGDGVAFRVWAPHAEAVWVAGTFNGWVPTASPLARDEDGCWSADVAGARPGDQYRFVVRARRRMLWRTDPYAAELEPVHRNGVVHDPAFDWGPGCFQMPPWHELVIYELHAGTFGGAGAPGFAGVEARLDHVVELGANCVELMPVTECAGDSSWGYDPCSLFAVRAAYGGPRGLKSLVRAAHERGLAVILDVVYNHLAYEYNPLWRFDGWSRNGRGGIYFYDDWRHATPWGERLDFGRPEVRRLVRDNLRWWLDEFRADGLRWDGTAYIRNAHGREGDPGSDLADGWRVMQEACGDTDRRCPWKLHVAEDLRNNGALVRAVEQGGAGFDTQWDSEFVHPVRAVLAEPRDELRRMAEVRRAVEHRYEGDPLRRVIYTESHDSIGGCCRAPAHIHAGEPAGWHARRRAGLGAVLLFTSPGIPMLFQGQELLLAEPPCDRTPLDWGAAERFPGVLRLYRDLARLRRNWFDTTRGLRGPHVHVHHVNERDKVVAFHRWERGGPRDDVVVVLNFADRAYDAYRVGFPRPGPWRVRLNSGWGGYGDGPGGAASFDTRAGGGPLDSMPASGAVGIGAYSAVILSQDDEEADPAPLAAAG